MADDKQDTEEQPAPSGGGKSTLIIVLVVTNLLVVAGAAGAVVMTMGSQPAATAEAAEPTGSGREVGPLLELSALVVNLEDPNGTHYLRAGFQLEIRDAERQAEVETRLVPLRSAVLLHLSGKSMDEVVGQENRAAILEELTELANEQIGGDLVRAIYFTEFVVQ